MIVGIEGNVMEISLKDGSGDGDAERDVAIVVRDKGRLGSAHSDCVAPSAL